MRGNKKRGRNAPHWKITENANVRSVAKKAARSVANMNQGVLEEDDLYQDALILIAGKPALAERAIVGEFGLLYNEVRADLLDSFVRPMDRRGELSARKYRNIPIEESEETEPFVMFDDGTGDYTEDAVKLLLPAVWDETYAYGLPDRENAPDKDMPKAASNKARSNSHWAYIADIKTGWIKTPLTLDERRALLLYYGMGWRQADIAANQGVSQKTISTRLDAAVKKITARLNGAGIEEED